MPTTQEYESRFHLIKDPILNQPYKNKAQARSIAAAAQRAIIAERIKARKEISNLWKQGFKVLKEENDRLQRELNDWFEVEMADVEKDIHDAIMRGPPEGTGRTMWLKGWTIDGAKMKANVRAERDDKTKEITLKWRDGFKALKAENDEFEKNLHEAYIGEREEIGNWLSDSLE